MKGQAILFSLNTKFRSAKILPTGRRPISLQRQITGSNKGKLEVCTQASRECLHDWGNITLTCQPREISKQTIFHEFSREDTPIF